MIVQECDAGLIDLRRIDGALAFAAPPVVRSGPVDDETLQRIVSTASGVPMSSTRSGRTTARAGWVCCWQAEARSLALRPGPADLDIGVAGPYPAGSPEAFEVRAFSPALGGVGEDPVTGSLNASLAGWLLASGHATAPYVASQGTVLGRRGRVHITRDPGGTIWVGGGTRTGVTGHVDL